MEEEEDGESGNEDGHAEVTSGLKKGRKRWRGKGAGDDEDIWAHIAPKASSGEAHGDKEIGAGLVGLHDVVQAPPRFMKVPREKFQAPGKGATKKGVIGLKRQAELGDARREVIDAYRALMKDNGRVGDRTKHSVLTQNLAGKQGKESIPYSQTMMALDDPTT